MTVSGSGGKTPQSIDTFQSTWGLSANDQPKPAWSRRSLSNSVRARQALDGQSIHDSRKGLDRIAGGWQFAGNYTYVSGTPVDWWGTTTVNTNNVIKVETTYGSYATSNHNLSNPAYTGDSGSLVGPSQNPSTGISRFNAANMVTAQNFIAGNLPAVDPSLRNPSWTQTDLSLMKNFYVGSEKRYFQVRAEAQKRLQYPRFRYLQQRPRHRILRADYKRGQLAARDSVVGALHLLTRSFPNNRMHRAPTAGACILETTICERGTRPVAF